MKKTLLFIAAAMFVIAASAQELTMGSTQEGLPKMISQEELKEMAKEQRMAIEMEWKKLQSHEIKAPAPEQTSSMTVLDYTEDFRSNGILSRKTVYYYDESGNMATQTIYSHSGGDLYVAEIYKYGANGSQEHLWLEENGEVFYGQKTEVTISEDGTRTETSFYWPADSKEWVPTSRYISGPNFYEYAVWLEESNDWRVNSRSITEYDSFGHIIHSEYYSFDYTTQSLKGISKYEYRYNEDDMMLWYSSYEWFEGNWRLISYSENEYNEKGLLTSEKWGQPLDYYGVHNTYTYNSQDLTETIVTQMLNSDNVWEYTSKLVHTQYDNDKVLTRDRYEYANEWVYVGTAHYSYEESPNRLKTFFSEKYQELSSGVNFISNIFSERAWDENNNTIYYANVYFNDSTFTEMTGGWKEFSEFHPNGQTAFRETYSYNSEDKSWELISTQIHTFDDQERMLEDTYFGIDYGTKRIYEYFDDLNYYTQTVYNLIDGEWVGRYRYSYTIDYSTNLNRINASYDWSDELNDFVLTYLDKLNYENGYLVLSEYISGEYHHIFKYENTLNDEGLITRCDEYFWSNDLGQDDFLYEGYTLYNYKTIYVNGIETAEADMHPEKSFNLLGQPVGADYKGIVIENGRKVVRR